MNIIRHIGVPTSAALCFVAALSGCGGNSSTESNSSTSTNANSSTSTSANTETGTGTSGGAKSLTGVGATFPALLYSRWFDSYKTAKGVQIDYQANGSGAGIKALTDQSVEFGASDAPLKADDKAKLPAPVVTLPTVAGAVAVAYNLPGGPKNLKLTGKTLADIYLGKITKWNDPAIASANAGTALPARAITVAHRSDGSGTSFIFTSYLKAVSPEWGTKIGAGKTVPWPTGLASKGNDGVASTIKGTPGSVGYVELAYAKGFSTASIQNKNGQFVLPSVAATTAAAEGSAAALKTDPTAPILNAAGAKAYPIAGFTYLMVYEKAKNPAKGAALKDFLKWAMTDGQQQAAPLDYAPLPKALAEQNLKTIERLK